MTGSNGPIATTVSSVIRNGVRAIRPIAQAPRIATASVAMGHRSPGAKANPRTGRRLTVKREPSAVRKAVSASRKGPMGIPRIVPTVRAPRGHFAAVGQAAMARASLGAKGRHFAG